MLEDIKEFNNHFGIPMLADPGFLSDEDMNRRLDFQLEELRETAEASGFCIYFDSTGHHFKRIIRNESVEIRNLIEILDGLVDQVYVALGTAAKMGFLRDQFFEVFGQSNYTSPWSIAWSRVHQANMKKERVPGQWRLVKPKGWVRPNLEDLCK